MTLSRLVAPTDHNYYHQQHVLMLLANLKKWTDVDLIAEYDFALTTLGEQVFKADFYLLSHDNQPDPVLTYGNQRVLDQWEVSWTELTQMHSRKTAKQIDRSERSALMAQVKTDNYLRGYSGIRVSKTGQEFQIIDGIIWNLTDDHGDFRGQAAWFKTVRPLL